MASITSRRPVRLLRAYRGHAPGTVLAVTQELATRLVVGNWAVDATTLDKAARRVTVERAVVSTHAEARGGVQ